MPNLTPFEKENYRKCGIRLADAFKKKQAVYRKRLTEALKQTISTIQKSIATL